MSVAFIPVKTPAEVEELVELADAIWHEYWPALIGPEQTDYMVEQFQSLEAITRDMREHDYEYWFLRADNEDAADAAAGAGAGAGAGRIVGYTGGHVEPETNRFFISKIYLLKEERGHGFASATIRFYEDLCRTRGLEAMYLTVNKYNEMGIRAYQAKGFETIESVETDIGRGFIMDDYVMEKRIDLSA